MRWSPPPPARYKINLDGLVFKAQKAVGIGVLIRDEQGRVVVVLSQKLNAPLGALEVEAKAVGVALQFARDVGISDFIMEGDSLIVYNALCGHSLPPSFRVQLDSVGCFTGLNFLTSVGRVINQPIY